MTRPYGDVKFTKRFQSSRPNGVTTTNRVRNALSGGTAAYLWKKAAAMAPGPAWVPTTLPMLV